jgi:CubicO group peptidase (beta-lactamase class C family)
MHMVRFTAPAATLLALLLTACSAARPSCPPVVVAAPAETLPSPSDFAALDAYVEAAMRDWGVPGLALAVVRGDELLHARGYGVRSLETREPVTTGTLFGLLSPTKTFTAAALGMLVDEGRLSWDDRVVDHVPSFRTHDAERTREIRIRDILSHRTGYPLAHRLWHGTEHDSAELMRRMDRVRPVAPMRQEFHYSNLMYLVAGEVIEAVSGMSWGDFVEERIFAPLGMERSTTSVRALAGRENVASPHARRVIGRFGAVRPIPYLDVDNVAPAGMIHTSAEEAAAWLRLLASGGSFEGRRLISAGSLGEMGRPHVPVAGDDAATGGDRAWAPLCGYMGSVSYGLGWFRMEYRGRPLLLHGGGINGQRSAVGLLPEEGAGVVILSNLQDTEIALALLYRVMDMFLEVEPRDWSAAYR